MKKNILCSHFLVNEIKLLLITQAQNITALTMLVNLDCIARLSQTGYSFSCFSGWFHSFHQTTTTTTLLFPLSSVLELHVPASCSPLASLWIINRQRVWLGCRGYMRKLEGVKPLDPHVPPIHHQYYHVHSLLHLGKLKGDLESDEAVSISSITKFALSLFYLVWRS